ncbi:MAG: hypothetical protein R3F59_01455 [Myxococcota bacterium]
MQMEQLVSLCKRRGFVYPSSEIYGGLNGFWDYGPLGVELKRNVKECWWRDMVTGHDDTTAPAGAPSPFQMVGLDSTIIVHPRIWKSSGHYDLFHDHMVDTHHLQAPRPLRSGARALGVGQGQTRRLRHGVQRRRRAEQEIEAAEPQALRAARQAGRSAAVGRPDAARGRRPRRVLGPDEQARHAHAAAPGFNLMFKTVVGALGGEDDAAFLRPETAGHLRQFQERR